MHRFIDNSPSLPSIIAAQQEVVKSIETFVDRYGPALKPHVLHDLALGLEHAQATVRWLALVGVGLGYGLHSFSKPAANPPDLIEAPFPIGSAHSGGSHGAD